MTMPAVVLEQSFTYSHATVMVEEVVRYIAPQQGATYLDATVGGGGHAAALLEACPEARLIGLDRDPVAVQAAGERLACFPGRVEVARVAFDGIFEFLQNKNIVRVQGLVADLGVSGPQLADADRGLSFRLDGPLDMRMDPTRGETARQLIQQLSQEELANVIYQLGEERRSRRVARCIKQALEAGELDTTRDLRRAVVRAVGPQKSGGVDPATRTFQALRMAVNDEMGQLRCLLELARRIVDPGGVAVFISFHSLEDRLVKRAFSDSTCWEKLTAGPVTALETERARNPRARSAKLRAARLIATDPDPESSPSGGGAKV